MEVQELDYTLGCIQDLLQHINRTDMLIKTHQEAEASTLVIAQYQEKKQQYALELWQHLQNFNLPLQLSL
jgi:hypothetical protein